ncbi:MAG: archaetidylserine decarboxylase [Proteobacteria bacterium]|nr:archaetidylserine decarboxylase [Pseudomonadota bacterium]
MDIEKAFKIWPQYVLPHHLLSRGMHALTRINGGAISHAGMRAFVRSFNVDMHEAVHEDVEHYNNFNAFFTRALKPEARPVDMAEDAIVSPIDGTVNQAGEIREGRIFQAKGHDYSAEELLGDASLAASFMNGQFATLYLSPRDYHRIHMPCDGTLVEMLHVPGRLFSVNGLTARNIPRLFARNERVVCLFETPIGRMALVAVGAIFVGSIETVWAGEITPPAGTTIRRWRYGRGEGTGEVHLRKGEEMGRFNMGSTVVMLTEPATVDWGDYLRPDNRMRMGARIGTKLG